MNAQMQSFFEAIGDALLLLDPNGRVGYLNAHAQSLLSLLPGETYEEPRVLKGLADLQRGLVSGPVSLTLDLDCGPVQARLIPMSGRQMFALLIDDTVEKAIYRQATQNLYAYLKGDLSRPLATLANSLGQLEAPPALLDQVKLVATRLERFVALSTLFGTTALVDTERLPLSELVDGALSKSQSYIERNNLTVLLDGLSAQLPPVYGSRRWLQLALNELIGNACKLAPPKSTLELQLHANGTHAMVVLRSHGQFVPPELARRAGVQAFVIDGTPARDAARTDAALGLALCEQVLHLHGGGLHILDSENGTPIEFRLELATGAPKRADETLDIAQAQRYAHDMAALLQRMRSNLRPHA